MATRQPNQTRPVKQPTTQKPSTQTRKPASQQSTPRQPPSQPSRPQPPQPSRQPPPRPAAPASVPAPAAVPVAPTTSIPHTATDATIGDGHPQPAHTTEKTTTLTTITTKDTTEKPYLDYLNDFVVDWKEPPNLEPIKSPRFHNAGRLSPRLRPIGTPPSLVSYRNRYNPRPGTTALPAFSPSRFVDPISMGTFGLDYNDYPYTDSLNSHGRKPSPLSDLYFRTPLYAETQPFGLPTHLNLPPLSMTNGTRSVFNHPSHRLALVSVPQSRFPDLDRLDTFIAPGVQHEPSNLDYVPHEALTNHYIEEFIGHYIEDQFLPDILHETIHELGLELKPKKRSAEVHKHVVDPFRFDIDKQIDDNQRNNTHLYSDDWIREMGLHSRPRPLTPDSNGVSNTSILQRIYFKEAPPIRAHTPLRYRDMMPGVQTDLVTSINQELIDFELQDMLRDLSRNAIADRHNERSTVIDTRRSVHHNVDPVLVRDVRFESPKRTRDQDNLIVRYMNQNGSGRPYDDDQGRLLDGTMLDNLIYQYHGREEYY